jgi:protein-S-isoprenylcysteine O-methyltransferase Ste14
MSFVARYLFKNNPELLERRMRMRERQTTQKLAIGLSFLFYLPAFIIPGLDVRFGWSNVPLVVVVIADVIVLLAYLMFVVVLKTNSYASRIVEVEKGQKVITTGPYAVIRHPMYLAVLILYGFSPLALGSYWAMLLLVLLILFLVIRIRGEEKELLENLEGYKEYTLKTRYRLLPGIW